MNAQHIPARLVADIGGTNARFALLDEHGMPQRVRVLPCTDHPDIVSAVEAYLSVAGGERPAVASIAIANPITGDRITMTNHHWSFSVREAEAKLGLDRLIVLNDFEALALALPTLTPDERIQIGGGTAAPGAPIGVLGPGTGLGAAGLIPVGKSWLPLAGEGGHVTLAATSDLEAEIISALRRRFGHVSAERVLSGPGLVALYETIGNLCREPLEELTPADVTDRALDGSDPLCREAVSTFCAMLGTVAGDLALTLGARGGIFLGGGILPQLGTFFERSLFRSRFEDKGRFATYLSAIPCYVIHSKYPALMGAARALDTHAIAKTDQPTAAGIR